MDKTRPIQIVRIRGNQDFFKKEGSGSSDLPKWATPQSIRENASKILDTLDSIEEELHKRANNDSSLPILLLAKINEDATAKSHRPNVKSVFRTQRKSNVIGIASIAELFVKIDSAEDLASIKAGITDVKQNLASKEKKIGVAAIKSLTRFHPEVNKANLDGKTIKIRLIDYKSDRHNSMAEFLFLRECKRFGIHVKKLSYASNLFLYKIENVELEQLEKIATMDSVISVKEMPYYEISAAPEPWYVDIDVANPSPDRDYPLIGILDSGVENIPQFTPWQIGKEHNAAGLDEHDINRNHGTMVASVALYGDELEKSALTGCGPSMFANCIINTTPDKATISEDELLIHIKSSVEQYPNVKIWNLSQGSSSPVADEAFSDFAIALDEIQNKYNILFCKSAGNAKSDNKRISQGAESVRCITVGSVCQKGEDPHDLPEGIISPFSRIGPGPEYLQKPDVVHYGGNKITGINVVTAPGLTSRERGTSFATPRVSSLAAHLAHRIEGKFDPTLIKALIIHHAQYASSLTKDESDVRYTYGFGIPTNIDRMLYNSSNEFTMIWQPEIIPTNSLDYQIIGFPFPNSMVDEDGNYYGIVTVTVVSNPVLLGSEGNEYCQNDIDVSIEPIDSIEYITVGAPGVSPIFRNETRVKSTKNILTPSAYSRKQSIYLKERNLIITNNKYQPVKKYQVDLSTLTPAVKAKMKGKGDWVLKIKGLTRDAAKDELTTLLNETGELVSVPVTIIISIKDPKGKNIAYDEGVRLLDQNNFVHSDILLRQDIAIMDGHLGV